MGRTLLSALTALMLGACGAKPDATNAAVDTAAATPVAAGNPAAAADVIPTTTFAPALGVDIATMTKTASGLYYKDLAVGTGAEAVVGKSVAVDYAGSLPDGTPFDASRGNPYRFTLGNREVIDGWDQGISGMKVGGKRLLVIPPELGYAGAGNGPIPPNAVLVFTVELRSVQ